MLVDELLVVVGLLLGSVHVSTLGLDVTSIMQFYLIAHNIIRFT